MHLLVSFLIFATLCGISIGVIWIVSSAQRQSRVSQVQHKAESLGFALSTAVEKAILAAYALKVLVPRVPEFLEMYAVVEQAPMIPNRLAYRNLSLTPEETWEIFNNASVQILGEREQVVGLVALELNPRACVAFAYPYSEFSVGLDLLAHPERTVPYYASIRTGLDELKGPFPLIEDGLPVFIAVVPIYLDVSYGVGMDVDTVPGENNIPDHLLYYGIAEVILDAASVLEDGKLFALEEEGYWFNLTRELMIDGYRVTSPAYSSENVSEIKGVVHNFEMVGEPWTIVLEPKSGFDPSWVRLGIIIASSLSLVITASGLVVVLAQKRFEDLKASYRTTHVLNELKELLPETNMADLKNLQSKIPQDMNQEYVAAQQLGAGSAGEVFKVLKVTRGRIQVPHLQYALKVVRKEGRILTKDQHSRLDREAKALEKCYNCPYVVTLHEHRATADNRCFWFMLEFLDGETLQDIIDDPNRGLLYESDVLLAAEQILRGLTHMHQERIIHRDIKPSNIVRFNRGHSHYRYTIIDLGSAVHTSAKGHLSVEVEGTVSFLPPEEASRMLIKIEDKTAILPPRQSFSPRIDVWAVGALIYNMVSGQLPFRGRDDRTVLSKIADLSTPAPSIYEDLPDSVRANFGIKTKRDTGRVIARALQKDSSRRFTSADHMLQTLSHPYEISQYTIFLSYRVATDAQVAQLLFDQLNNTLTPRGRHKVTVYLDRARLVDGEEWEKGFQEGLCKSLIHMPIMSYGFCAPLAGEGITDILEPKTQRLRLRGSSYDREDNVLQEQQIAIALLDNAGKTQEKIHLKKILPIMVGQLDPHTGEMSDFYQDGSNGGGGRYPDLVSWPTSKAVLSFVQQRYDLDLEDQAETWTVKNTVDRLLEFQSLNLGVSQDSQPLKKKETSVLKRKESMSKIGFKKSTLDFFTEMQREQMIHLVTALKEQIWEVVDELREKTSDKNLNSLEGNK